MGVDLYPASIMKGDLSPDSFGSEVDDICNEINEACKVRLISLFGSASAACACVERVASFLFL